MRRYLRAGAAAGGTFRLEPVVKKGKAAAGVDWDDRDSLYERMDGRG